MAQFDVRVNLNTRSKKRVPYLLDVQNDLLDDLMTRVVVPLVLASAIGGGAERLNPAFKIKGRNLAMSTAEMAGVPKNILGEKITSLIDERNQIIGAIDFLFTGI
jgi:toxin CcdB